MADLSETLKRYGAEREKRLRSDANAQYTEVASSEQHQHLTTDPWVDPARVKNVQTMFPDGYSKVLVLGAGWSGLLFAVRMVQAGISPADIRIVDNAGGFGGCWYWNKYPGLKCDVESYTYLPLLEETGYIPPHRYAYGKDIQAYADLVADKWNLTDSAVFQTLVKGLDWDEEAKEWSAKLVQNRSSSGITDAPQTLDVRAQCVVLASGLLHWPKLPDIPGISDYKGETFHTSRWSYEKTGGSPADPSMIKLQDKRVAIIGTGCTAVQAVPHLARWAKELYVVQRTPSAVDVRDQRDTDADWFRREVATGAGWQRKRIRNFNQHFTTGPKPEVDLVNDGWSKATGMAAIVGNKFGPKTFEEMPAYYQKMQAIDLPRQSRIRDRVMETVKNPDVASKLQAWYPTWCKRPAFDDDYLESFNQPNVTLIDTDGKGLDRITADSIVSGTKSYAVDMIIFSTGYRSPSIGSPAEWADIVVRGRGGVSMAEAWARDGPTTLHGLIDGNFPNLFMAGLRQVGANVNYLCHIDTLAKEGAYILSEAQKQAGDKPFAIAPSPAAMQAWANEIIARTVTLGSIVGCTPSYASVEGAIEKIPPEERMKKAKASIWGHGVEDWVETLDSWRANGGMQGIEVQT